MWKNLCILYKALCMLNERSSCKELLGIAKERCYNCTSQGKKTHQSRWRHRLVTGQCFVGKQQATSLSAQNVCGIPWPPYFSSRENRFCQCRQLFYMLYGLFVQTEHAHWLQRLVKEAGHPDSDRNNWKRGRLVDEDFLTGWQSWFNSWQTQSRIICLNYGLPTNHLYFPSTLLLPTCS